jgi:hypothetical protein
MIAPGGTPAGLESLDQTPRQAAFILHRQGESSPALGRRYGVAGTHATWGRCPLAVEPIPSLPLEDMAAGGRIMPGDRIAPGSSVMGRGDLVVMNIFEDSTAIARVLGLDIQLPDPDNEDPTYWDHIHANGGYKRRIEGRIADPWLEGDPDWALLLRLPWGEVWFDIEEGIKLFFPASEITHALLLLGGLRSKGISLTGEDGRSLVWVSPTQHDDPTLERVRERLEAAGLVQGLNEIVWVVPVE